MHLKDFNRYVRELVSVEPSESPVISFYVEVAGGRVAQRSTIDERVRTVRKSLVGASRRGFEEALGRVESFLTTSLLPDARGAAIFARGGDRPLFTPLQFRVPLPNWFSVHSTPNIYHLVELKDTYHRYVILIASEKEARILEVNLGSVTEEIWRERAETIDRIGERWGRERYRHHRQIQTQAFIKEKIQLLDRLMSRGGHTHLILAGPSALTERVRSALPKHLAAKLVDSVETRGSSRPADVVLSTLAAFIAREERESQAVVDLLRHELETGGSCEVGPEACLRALRWEQADTLVMAKSWWPEPAWMCNGCRATVFVEKAPKACVECGEHGFQPMDPREEMVRVAERSGCLVEIVDKSEWLERLGGVGCLLRFRILDPEREATNVRA